MTVPVRAEVPEDRVAVREVNVRAFPTSAEADLVDALRGRADAGPAISLVAREADGGRIVGHILFTRVHVRPAPAAGAGAGHGTGAAHGAGAAPAWPALALGPMAVDPSRQRRGIGSALVRAGLDACLRAGEPVVFVLGHAGYYPRFGFVPARPRGLACKWTVPDDVFLVAELSPGALAGRSGRVEYHAVFDSV